MKIRRTHPLIPSQEGSRGAVPLLGRAGVGFTLIYLTPYVSASPQSNWDTAENFNHGSMHHWGVWYGNDDINGFKNNIGRFLVERGFQSFPDDELLAEYVSPEYLSLDSEVMKNRQKSYVGNKKRIEQMEKWMFGTTMPELSLEEFVMSTQMKNHQTKKNGIHEPPPHCGPLAIQCC